MNIVRRMHKRVKIVGLLVLVALGVFYLWACRSPSSSVSQCQTRRLRIPTGLNSGHACIDEHGNVAIELRRHQRRRLLQDTGADSSQRNQLEFWRRSLIDGWFRRRVACTKRTYSGCSPGGHRHLALHGSCSRNRRENQSIHATGRVGDLESSISGFAVVYSPVSTKRFGRARDAKR